MEGCEWNFLNQRGFSGGHWGDDRRDSDYRWWGDDLRWREDGGSGDCRRRGGDLLAIVDLGSVLGLRRLSV